MDRNEQTEFFGRAVGTQGNPITPVSFPFWANDLDVEVEVGDVVTAVQNPTSTTPITAVGITDNLEQFSDVRDTLQAFLSHNLGDVSSEPPTERPLVLQGNVQVIWRSDGKHRPIQHGSQVRHANISEIQRAYAGQIPTDKQVLAGFIRSAVGDYVPIPLHADFLLGPEAAHVNISGASGLATKTSYALFLLRSLQSFVKETRQDLAIIGFNVKHDDLLWLDKTPSDFDKALAEANLQEQEKLFSACEPFFNPYSALDVKYFVPQGHPRRQDIANRYSYGLVDLLEAGGRYALHGLFEPDALDEKLEALVLSLATEAEDSIKRHQPHSFNTLLEELRRRLTRVGTGQSRSTRTQTTRWEELYITLGGMPHHVLTVQRLLRDMPTALDKLASVLKMDSPQASPLPLNALNPGDFWIVDIEPLNDLGKRLIFYRVLSHVAEHLVTRLKGFPQKVVIFVDELNKFAPKGARGRLLLKSQVIDITSRGRSIGLINLGAEQFASDVDDEVLGNCATFVVGYSRAPELRDRAYDWMAEGLKRKAQALPKGQMLLHHAFHRQPALISFPVPMHDLWRKEQEANARLRT